jgi:hypothetical protein
MDDLIDCKKQSHQILDQCKTKITENFFKCCEGYALNNRRSAPGCELQSFDVFGEHLTTSDLFQNYDRKDTCDKHYKCDICDEVRVLTYRITLEHILVINLINVICGKGFSKNSNFQNHIRSHTCDKPYKCDIYMVECLVRIPSYRHTLKHILVINLINVMYVVKDLIRILTYRNTLEHILVINLMNVMYVVKGFNQNSHLQKHIIIHTGDKPYKI